MALHMIKLVVGAATIEDLLAWRANHSKPGEPWILRTRMTPKRGAEMVVAVVAVAATFRSTLPTRTPSPRSPKFEV